MMSFGRTASASARRAVKIDRVAVGIDRRRVGDKAVEPRAAGGVMGHMAADRRRAAR